MLAELLLGQPIFPGDSGVDQLVEVIKVLGTPTREQIREMNPNYTEFKFPQIKSHPWQKVSSPHHSPHKLLMHSSREYPIEYTNIAASRTQTNPSHFPAENTWINSLDLDLGLFRKKKKDIHYY